jgi:hypothetical protein
MAASNKKMDLSVTFIIIVSYMDSTFKYTMCVMPRKIFNHIWIICNPCPVMVDTVRSLPPEQAGQNVRAPRIRKWVGLRLGMR